MYVISRAEDSNKRLSTKQNRKTAMLRTDAKGMFTHTNAHTHAHTHTVKH